MSEIVLITNNPAPYREKVHELIDQHFDGHYHVIYCAERESDRKWNFQHGTYKKEFLSAVNDGVIHNNPKIVRSLKKIDPDTVIIMGFYPSMLYAYLWATFKKKSIIVFTDGSLKSESYLTVIHQFVRKIVFKKAKAFLGPSNGSAALYKSYGIDKKKFFRTYLSVNNQSFFQTYLYEKKYDLMFSGQFIERKMPFFFIEVAKKVKEQFGKCNVLILGSGPLKNRMLELLKKYEIEFYYPGYIRQEELPQYYSQSKLFLFPTQNDPWGVVANEAMASGVPVITCDRAGVANDLVIDQENGYVLDLEVDTWVKYSIKLLTNSHLYEKFSQNSISHVQKYNYANAANGIIEAIEFSRSEK